jgi:hypothetical protein
MLLIQKVLLVLMQQHSGSTAAVSGRASRQAI